MDHHVFEVSELLGTQSKCEDVHRRFGQEATPLELAILCGSMAHSMSSFTISDDGDCLRLEWVQRYTI
jgi:hypothetical protein